MARNNILLLGEAYGEQEEAAGQPFVGKSGYLLKTMLSQVGIRYDDCYATNVFNLRPRPSNDITNLCGPRTEGIPSLPMLQRGKFVRAEYAKELERLYAEIRREAPNLIIALGATAAWALLHTSGIMAIRGTTTPTHPSVTRNLGRPFKVLPTYHPANISREWTNRPIVLTDLDKARRESYFPEVRRPSRSIWLRPTIADLAQYEREFILPAERLSVDIESKGDQVTCIGFAPTHDSAIVIPFYSELARDGNYWRETSDELLAWDYVRRWCAIKPLTFQNGAYDMSFLWRRYGITCPLADADTMLLHHSHQLEMRKGLGFLATLYTDEASWKFMRKASEQKGHD